MGPAAGADSPLPASVVVVIGLHLPRSGIPHLAAVSQNFAAACEHAVFWQRLWCVLPPPEDIPGSKSPLQPLEACIRRVRSALEFRLTRYVASRHLRLGAVLPALDRLTPGLNAAVSGGSLQVLALEGSLGACADPIFGTRYERQRQALEAGKDVFAALAAAFEPAPSGCQLRRLRVSRGSFSAASFGRFLRAARPPLEALELESAVLHGRSFPGIIAALREAHPCPERLAEFATNEFIGGEDPIALLAGAFPGLQALKVARLFGSGPPRGLQALRQLFPRLRASRCRFPRAGRKLEGGFKIDSEGYVNWFITSDHYDDDYRGQGLTWAELDNTSECMFSWKVGRGVAHQQVLDFMRECGIEYRQRLANDIQVSDDEADEDEEEGEEGHQEQHADCVVEGCAAREWVPPDSRSESEDACEYDDEDEDDDAGGEDADED